jgi:DNA-binding transcriptional regulator YdaS (Cro superfamily)
MGLEAETDAELKPDVEILRTFLNSITRVEQEDFAFRCGTTVGYLRKAISTGERMRESLVIDMERESEGKVRCEPLRPDVDWAYLRGTSSSPGAEPATRKVCG